MQEDVATACWELLTSDVGIKKCCTCSSFFGRLWPHKHTQKIHANLQIETCVAEPAPKRQKRGAALIHRRRCKSLKTLSQKRLTIMLEHMVQDYTKKGAQ